MSLRKAYLLIFIILIVDQVSKIYIKTNFVLGEEVEVLNGSKFYLLKMKVAVLKFLPTVNYFNALDLSLWVELGIGCGIQSKEKQFKFDCCCCINTWTFGNIIDSVFYGVILMTVTQYYIVFRTALWRLFSR
jgi:signal peptidase II